MSRILVVDGEQRSALAIVRSLGRAGHEVFVCSGAERPIAGASRFAVRSDTIPDPRADAAAFASAVRALVARHSIDVVIPATDASAVPVATLEGLEDSVSIAFPDVASYRAVSDKRALMDVAVGLGVSVPDQLVVESESELPGADAWARERSYEVVLKPARSAVQDAGAISSFSVAIANSEDEYRAALKRYPATAYPLLLQERIRGPGTGAFMLTREGEPVASFAHRRIREKPPTGGVSVYRESVPLRDDVRHAAETILRYYRWTGVAMVEFKEDERTGTPYLMEVNGRFWGSLQLAIDAGVDFPSLLLDVVQGRTPEAVQTYRLGVRSRWFWGDVDHLLWILRRGRRHRSDFPDLPSIPRALARFLVPWRPGDRFEVLRLSDPRPFLRESAAWVGQIARSTR